MDQLAAQKRQADSAHAIHHVDRAGVLDQAQGTLNAFVRDPDGEIVDTIG